MVTTSLRTSEYDKDWVGSLPTRAQIQFHTAHVNLSSTTVSSVVSCQTDSTGILSDRGARWNQDFANTMNSGFGTGSPRSENRKRAREGREKDVAGMPRVHGVGRTGKAPAAVPPSMVKALGLQTKETGRMDSQKEIEMAEAVALFLEKQRNDARDGETRAALDDLTGSVEFLSNQFDDWQKLRLRIGNEINPSCSANMPKYNHEKEAIEEQLCVFREDIDSLEGQARAKKLHGDEIEWCLAMVCDMKCRMNFPNFPNMGPEPLNTKVVRRLSHANVEKNIATRRPFQAEIVEREPQVAGWHWNRKMNKYLPKVHEKELQYQLWCDARSENEHLQLREIRPRRTPEDPSAGEVTREHTDIAVMDTATSKQESANTMNSLAEPDALTSPQTKQEVLPLDTKTKATHQSSSLHILCDAKHQMVLQKGDQAGENEELERTVMMECRPNTEIDEEAEVFNPTTEELNTIGEAVYRDKGRQLSDQDASQISSLVAAIPVFHGGALRISGLPDGTQSTVVQEESMDLDSTSLTMLKQRNVMHSHRQRRNDLQVREQRLLEASVVAVDLTGHAIDATFPASVERLRSRIAQFEGELGALAESMNEDEREVLTEDHLMTKCYGELSESVLRMKESVKVMLGALGVGSGQGSKGSNTARPRKNSTVAQVSWLKPMRRQRTSIQTDLTLSDPEGTGKESSNSAAIVEQSTKPTHRLPHSVPSVDHGSAVIAHTLEQSDGEWETVSEASDVLELQAGRDEDIGAVETAPKASKQRHSQQRAERVTEIDAFDEKVSNNMRSRGLHYWQQHKSLIVEVSMLETSLSEQPQSKTAPVVKEFIRELADLLRNVEHLRRETHALHMVKLAWNLSDITGEACAMIRTLLYAEHEQKRRYERDSALRTATEGDDVRQELIEQAKSGAARLSIAPSSQYVSYCCADRGARARRDSGYFDTADLEEEYAAAAEECEVLEGDEERKTPTKPFCVEMLITGAYEIITRAYGKANKHGTTLR